MTITRLSRRPAPTIPDGYADWFEPDQAGLGEWVRETFINDDGALYNERHQHLGEATIGWLWTNAEHRDRNMTVLGMCQLVAPVQAKWSSARSHHQLVKWFGAAPDFVITISSAAAELSDREFCALISHELHHAEQDIDPFGAPRFTKQGRPIFRVVGHDFEEFVGVVNQFGATSHALRAAVEAINAGPLIDDQPIQIACGTCRSR